MILKRCILLSTLLLSFAMINAQAASMDIQPGIIGQGNIISKQIPLPAFNAIHISGDMQVKLIAATDFHDVRVIGNPNLVQQVSAKVSDGTLFLRLGSRYRNSGKLVAIIRAQRIDNLSYQGRGNLSAIDVDSPSLHLAIDTPGIVDLSGSMGINQLDLAGSGVININGLKTNALSIKNSGRDVVNIHGVAELRSVNFSGSGWLSMYWINSAYLNVRGSGNAYLQLAGRVGTLNVKLKDRAYFNGHYLRSDAVFAKTYDFSRADLQVSQVQNALARDSSNIYYYTPSNFHADYMGEVGTVLDVSGIR